ncbi:hypothetical protein HDU67_001590 [Dinochytrium kinnereticum]|nr:hypothetical protein HDU67_001590 [Dinochytrium kinnereticum]
MNEAREPMSAELDRMRKLQLSAAWDHIHLGAENLEETLAIDEDDDESFVRDAERFSKKIGEVNMLCDKLKEATESMRKFHAESRATAAAATAAAGGGFGGGAGGGGVGGRFSATGTGLNTPLHSRSRHASAATQRG